MLKKSIEAGDSDGSGTGNFTDSDFFENLVEPNAVHHKILKQSIEIVAATRVDLREVSINDVADRFSATESIDFIY